MKIAALIAGLLLGFVFVALPGALLLGLMHPPPPDPASPAGQFFGVFYSTGWLKLVQLLQILGGVLVAIPKTRNFGLLILGPIVVNILAFHILVMKGGGLAGPPLVVAVLAAFLLFAERRKFAALAN
jgi:putative oxidoreductase